jgi:hypothetical protein
LILGTRIWHFLLPNFDNPVEMAFIVWRGFWDKDHMESMISLFSIYHCLELLGDIVDRAYIVAVVDLWAV